MKHTILWPILMTCLLGSTNIFADTFATSTSMHQSCDAYNLCINDAALNEARCKREAKNSAYCYDRYRQDRQYCSQRWPGCGG